MILAAMDSSNYLGNQVEGGLLRFLVTHPAAHPITYNHRMVTAQIVNQKPSVLILAFAKKSS
jgi:hypothetical protein